MTPEEIKAVRVGLRCTAKELAAALDVEPALIATWERGEAFPTKRHVAQLQSFMAAGPAAFPRKSKGVDPLEALRDPEVWALIRKLLVHPKLRAQVGELAAKYDEP